VLIDADMRRRPGNPTPPGRDRPRRSAATRSAFTAVRRWRGLLADELFVLCRPRDGAGGASRQAEAAYEALCAALASAGAAADAVVRETVFLRQVADAPAVRAARAHVLGREASPATTVIGQPPLGRHAPLTLSAVAIVPRPGTASSVHEVVGPGACPCAVCARGVRATVVRLGEETAVHAGSVHGAGRDAFAEAYDAFRTAEGLLAAAGMDFRDVVRTWLHVRDIDRDYAALNAARRAFFADRGIGRHPASTGVQGIPFPAAHDFSMSFYAVKSSGPLDVTVMSAPSLNEASTYGADFSRGLRLARANGVALHVSGTASVDEAGRTAHAGDFAAQVERMLHNLASLLGAQGATFDAVVSGITYLKRPGDAPLLRAMFRERGFDRFPCAVVEAPLCRPELLCETEAVAMMPPVTGAA
jgi:enamine deaminase RidA (YjgF/YER057c/UK114 family)